MDSLDIDVIDVKKNVFPYDNEEKYIYYLDFLINGTYLRDFLTKIISEIKDYDNGITEGIISLYKGKKKVILYRSFYGKDISIQVTESKVRFKWKLFYGDTFLIEFHFDREEYKDKIRGGLELVENLQELPVKLKRGINLIEDDPEEFSYERDFVDKYRLDRFDIFKKYDMEALREAISYPYYEMGCYDNRPEDKWWWNLDRIRDIKYPAELLPEYLRDYYLKFKEFFKNKIQLPDYMQEVYRNQFSGKALSENPHHFIIKGKKDYIFALNKDGNLSLTYLNNKDYFTELPFDKKILFRQAENTGFNFGLDRILKIKQFFEFMEEKMYVKAYKVLEGILPDRSIVSLVMDNFEIEESINFLIEAKYGIFNSNFSILKDSDLLAEHYFRSHDIYYTRVVGVEY